MQHNTSQLLFAYWDQLRAGRCAPKRTEIDPACIATILPQTLLLECQQPTSYRFRIAGTKLCEYLGMELHGYNFLDLWQPDDRIEVQEKLKAIAMRGDRVTLNVHSHTTRGENVYSEVLLLPLSLPDGTIHRILGAWSLSGSSAWSGYAPLIQHSPIDPEIARKPCRRPQTSVPPGIDNGLIQGRIVNSLKRRFRVYDGGRL